MLVSKMISKEKYQSTKENSVFFKMDGQLENLSARVLKDKLK